jgi:hypothetical protein
MNTLSANLEADTVNDSQELATWNRPRTSEELQNFITSHHASLPEGISIE